MPKKMTQNRLEEASNLSTEEKMTLWANGQRRENIRAAGDAKLDNFAGASIYLAERTTDAGFARRLLDNNVQAICGELRNRGLTSLAQKYEAERTRVVKKINDHLQNVDAFAKTAFDIIADKCIHEEAEDVNILANYSATLRDPNNLPKNMKIVTVADINLLHIFNANSAIQSLNGNYLANSYWGPNVVDSGTINLTGNIGVQDFAERLFWSLYNISILGAQTLMAAKKIAQSHPEMRIIFSAYLGYGALMLPRFQIDIALADDTTQRLEAAYNLAYLIKKPYQEIKTQDVVIMVTEITENYSVNNYGFKSFASICKKFMSQL